ncbi:nucleolar complex protein 3 [Clonorchis sinensis]|uniref:NOC3-like protein n=1 Tax=Clonorchis sinensis TaxID=79923 RepID=H2KQW5_CLOSI|nr:nucleolar complex protein 3 [Clonorchis sinensis]
MGTNAGSQDASGIHQLLVERKQTFETKLAIVMNCECVLQSPEANMASLRELMKLFEAKKIISIKEIRLALIASLCVVFKDILPAYRIRSLTEQEKTQQMKKETRKLQFFEENLLINYRKYTEVLRVILQSKSLAQKSSRRQETYAKINWNESDRMAALKAVCELLKAHPHFNLSDELIMAVLPFLNDKREQVYSIVLKTLQLIFSDDCDGKFSLEICRAIHAFAKKKSYNIRPAIARALSLVPIKEVEDAGEKTSVGRNRKMMSRRERKKDKLEKKHEKEMAETRATQSREDRKKLNTLILNEILFVYFKLLKTTNNSQLLTAVLEGVATYSCLINVIYVDSLLSILNRFIAQESTSLRDGLNCVNAALNILNHPGSTSALETDPTRFYNHLYSLLGRISGVCSPCDKIRTNTKLDSLSTAYARSSTPAAYAVAQYVHKNAITKPISSVPDSPNGTPDDEHSKGRVVLKDSEGLTDVMLSSLNMLLIRRRRDVSSNRVLAFVKRLAGAALAMSEPSCTGTILVLLIHLLRLFPRCEVLFDSETEVGGAYRPDVDDPEACLPASACLWELVALERHPSLVVRELAKAALHWGRTIHTYGPTEAAIRRFNFKIGPKDLTLDHLIQLSPADCRLQLATICEEQSAEPVPVTPTTKKRFRQTYVLSDWFKSMLEQSGLSKEYGDVLHSKRPRIEKS